MHQVKTDTFSRSREAVSLLCHVNVEHDAMGSDKQKCCCNGYGYDTRGGGQDVGCPVHPVRERQQDTPHYDPYAEYWKANERAGLNPPR